MKGINLDFFFRNFFFNVTLWRMICSCNKANLIYIVPQYQSKTTLFVYIYVYPPYMCLNDSKLSSLNTWFPLLFFLTYFYSKCRHTWTKWWLFSITKLIIKSPPADLFAEFKVESRIIRNTRRLHSHWDTANPASYLRLCEEEQRVSQVTPDLKEEILRADPSSTLLHPFADVFVETPNFEPSTVSSFHSVHADFRYNWLILYE